MKRMGGEGRKIRGEEEKKEGKRRGWDKKRKEGKIGVKNKAKILPMTISLEDLCRNY